MRHEGAGDFNPVLHEGFNIAYDAIFTGAGQMPNAIGKMCPGGYQVIRQVEHIFKTVVAGGELQVLIINA